MAFRNFFRLFFTTNEMLSEQQVQMAVSFVAQADVRFRSNDARREWCVEQLRRTGQMPEWLARIAVEVGLQLAKQQQVLRPQGRAFSMVGGTDAAS